MNNNKGHQEMVNLWREHDAKFNANETPSAKSRMRHDRKELKKSSIKKTLNSAREDKQYEERESDAKLRSKFY